MRNENENGGVSQEAAAEPRRDEAAEGERAPDGVMDRADESGETGKPQPWDRLEHALAEQLTGGPLEDADSEQRIKDRISPRYEIRIQTELDPIVEETKQYRKLAKEIDDRYDRFDK